MKLIVEKYPIRRQKAAIRSGDQINGSTVLLSGVLTGMSFWH